MCLKFNNLKFKIFGFLISNPPLNFAQIWQSFEKLSIDMEYYRTGCINLRTLIRAALV